MPDRERWQRVQELFDTAAALDPAERDRYLTETCAGDAELRSEVETLLEAGRRAADDEFITGAIAAVAQELAAGTASWEGRMVGPYRLVGELAHGGMGMVYLAERADASYEAQVAIKLVRGGIAGPELVRRFLSERQILANLAHPNIARLLDGGTTEDGTPYLVMERIQGEPIDEYCDTHELNQRQRLDLFCQVCDAVHHAHRHLVVHRDIKPSNILVTADGAPKLLDFGVATLVDPEGTNLATEIGVRMLTPAYASPEQVLEQPITTSTDVYSLGVLLYRLLTGSLPYGLNKLRGPQLARAIAERQPEPPGRVVARSGQRATRPGRDLDAVVLTALEKDPARRYASVEAFADDVRRYLGGMPVRARPATTRYRLGKFVARHRRSVLAGAGAVALVVCLTGFYVARLERERDFANAERQKYAEVSAFLERLFRVADPTEAHGRSVTAREVLDSAVARLPHELAGQPEVRAAMLYTLGGVYTNLGLRREALPLLQQGFTLRRADPGRGSPTIGDYLYRLGDLELVLAQFDTAESLLINAANRLEAEYPHEDKAAFALLDLANAYRRAGRLAAGDSALDRAMADVRNAPNDSVIAGAFVSRSALYLAEGRAVDAEPAARQALERYRKLFRADDPRTITAMNNLGQALYRQSRYTEAEPIMRQVLTLRQRVDGTNHPQTATAWNNLAALLRAEGRYDEAADAARHAVAIYRTTYGQKHERVAVALSNLASILLAGGKPGEAERTDRQALQIEMDILPPGHIDIAVLYNNLAHVFEVQGRWHEAERSYRQALAVIAKGIGVETQTGSIFLANLGGALAHEGRYKEAEPELRHALAIQRKILPAQHATTATTLTTLGDLLVNTHRAAEAEPLLREALEMRTALLKPDHWAIQVTRSVLGECLADLGRPAEAAPLLASSAEALQKRLGPNDERARTALQRAEHFYRAQGDSAQAQAFRAELAAGK
jgi:tetratricopeptide (TPR) repeat protein